MARTDSMDTSHIWVVIPVFNNKGTVLDVARRCRQRIDNVLVVDDGSTDADVEQLFSGTDISILRHAKNMGKGMALRTALRYLQQKGAEFMITIDADGQHNPENIDRFIPLLQRDGTAIIVGARDFVSPDIPESSRFGRTFSNFWLRLETGEVIADSQSGFRAYPIKYLSRMRFYGSHYDFEVEVLTRAVWSGLELLQVPIDVFYPPPKLRVTSFRPFWDNLRITLMHTRLVGRRLLPFSYPRLVRRATAAQRFSLLKHPVKLFTVLLRENTTPLGLAAAAAVGIFLGALPLIASHILVAAYVASRLHLNKVMTLAAQNVCAPPFVPAACIELGHFMLYRKWLTDISWHSVFGEIPKRLWEWLVGSLIVGPVLAALVGMLVLSGARVLLKRNYRHADRS